MTRTPAFALAAILALATAAPAEEPPAPPAPRKPTDQEVLEGLVGKAKEAVEKARGLPFKEALPVAPVTAEAFVEKSMKDLERVLGGADLLPPASRLLARLGVIAEGADFRALVAKFLEGNIAANYDPETKRISFLPGAPRDPALMVHEVTHALDDQQFDMKGAMKSWNGQFDRMLAYGALCEGDAMSVEYRYRTQGGIAKQPLADLRAFADMMATAVLQGKYGATPPGIVLAFKSQYLEGAIFAETLRRSEKGEEAVNAAFKAPPVSTEQILHPEKYLAGEAPVSIALPAPPEGAKVLFTTALGELGARIVHLSRGAKKEEAEPAAAGWAGDTVALVSFPAGEAVVWVSAWDTEADAAEFLEAMKKAFPLVAGGEGKPQRGLIQRGTTVEFVEAPLDALADAVAMAKAAERR